MSEACGSCRPVSRLRNRNFDFVHDLADDRELGGIVSGVEHSTLWPLASAQEGWA